jgi:hypothetical protein
VFDQTGTRASVSGYGTLLLTFLADGIETSVPPIDDGRPYLLAARCPRPAQLDVRGISPGLPAIGSRVRIDCVHPVPGGYEGTLELDLAAQRALLGNLVGAVELTTSDSGSWTFAALAGDLPDWIPVLEAEAAWSLDGRNGRAGGRFSTPTDAEGNLSLSYVCVRGVVLAFRVNGEEFFPPQTCDGERHVLRAAAPVQRPGTVTVAVTRTGRDTGQWRVNAQA